MANQGAKSYQKGLPPNPLNSDVVVAERFLRRWILRQKQGPG
jgi:hypothetical protein